MLISCGKRLPLSVEFDVWGDFEMDNQIVTLCGWFHCDEPAYKHVDFGERFFDTPMTLDGRDIPRPYEHLNLCTIHIAEAHSKYKEVVERDLPKEAPQQEEIRAFLQTTHQIQI